MKRGIKLTIAFCLLILIVLLLFIIISIYHYPKLSAILSLSSLHVNKTMSYSEHAIKLSNFSDESIRDSLIEFNLSYKIFLEVAYKFSDMENKKDEISFDYSQIDYENINELKIIKCDNLDQVSKKCKNISFVNFSLDKTSRRITGYFSGIGIYLLVENKCGNGICEPMYWETTAACPVDCRVFIESIFTKSIGGGGTKSS